MLKLSEAEKNEMTYKYDEMENTKKMEGVLFNITITPCVWRDKTKSQNLLSMTNIPIHHLSSKSYAATANLFGTDMLLLHILD